VIKITPETTGEDIVAQVAKVFREYINEHYVGEIITGELLVTMDVDMSPMIEEIVDDVNKAPGSFHWDEDVKKLTCIPE